MTIAINDQDLVFIVDQPSAPKARADQDVQFVIIQKAIPGSVDQEVMFALIKNSIFPFPILPIQIQGQNFNKAAQPIRGPSWNVKTVSEWSTLKQQTVSGRTLVVKQRQGRLAKWEFTFEFLIDDPNHPNGYYTAPISATDMEVLTSFFSSVAAAGSFAFQPPDTARGGVFKITGVTVTTANIAVISTDGVIPVTRLRLGDIASFSGVTTSTYLNGQNGTVIGISLAGSNVTVSIPTSGTHAFVSDTGTMPAGQPLPAADANFRSALVNTIGAYPNSISPTATVTTVTDQVQLIDIETVSVYANGVPVSYRFTNATATGRALLSTSPPTVAPYNGIVLQFGSAPATPLIAIFNYYYVCRFSDDTQEYQNFLTMLWACSSVKIEQVRQ